MEFPYPDPEFVKTKLRCQFSMPGRRYDCRSVGHYILNGRRYCGWHYDTAWKVQNPEFGQQHEWHTRVNKFTGVADPWPSCKQCGDIRVHDGLPQSKCRGKFDRIGLREAATG